MRLSDQVVYEAVHEPKDVTGGAIVPTVLDISPYQEVTIVYHLGAVGAAGFTGGTIELHEAETSGGSYASIGSSATVTVNATNDDNKVATVTLINDGRRKPFIKPVATGGANAVLLSVMAVCFRKHSGSPVSAATGGSYCAAGTRTSGLLSRAVI